MRSDEILRKAENDLGAVQKAGLHYYIVLVAYLDWIDVGLSSSTAIERAVLKVERVARKSRSSFATSASFARAIWDYGLANGIPLQRALRDLGNSSDVDRAFTLITSVHARDAVGRRAGSLPAQVPTQGIRPSGSILDEVIELTNDADAGDSSALAEAATILSHLRNWASGKVTR